MSIERYIADRISGAPKDKTNISKPIVKIAITGIVLGVAVMLLTISIVTGFKKEITRKITGLTSHISISSINVNPGNEPFPISIHPDTVEMLKNLAGLKHLQCTAVKNAILKTDKENEGVMLKGIDKEYDLDFLQKHLVEGKVPEFSDSAASKDILISRSMADKMALKPGDKMLLYFLVQHEINDTLSGQTYVKSEQRSRKLQVCGIFKTDFSDFDNNLAFVDLKQIRKLNYWNENTSGTYEISIDDLDKLEEKKAAIEDLLGYQYNVRSVRDIYSNIFIWLDKLDINGVIIVVLMIVVAVINMITALLILILERTNMVGLVKSLGMSNLSVRKVFFYVSLRLIGRGLLWGNLIGICLVLIQYYFKVMKLDPETYYVSHVAVDVNWLYFLLLNAGTFLVCLGMLYFPSLIITKLTPIKTLRFD